MSKIFQYIELAVSLLTVVPTFIALWALKQQVTASQIQTDIQPVLSALGSVLPSFNPNPAIVLDFCQAFADVFNKYVASSSTILGTGSALAQK